MSDDTGKNRILFIVEAMGGGVFTYIVDLANALADSYEMYIAYSVRRQTPENYRDYLDPRIHLIPVQHFDRAIHPVKDWQAFHEIRRIAQEVRPDIIHLHSSKAGAIGRIAFGGSIPLFYTPHGYSFLMDNYGFVKRMLFHLIERVCALRPCTTISCSLGEHQETCKMTRRALYVNNGIDTDELASIALHVERQDHPFTVCTIGRICRQKDPDTFNRIALQMPDVQFVWIGDGDLGGCLRAENITITGWLDRASAIGHAVNADAFVLTSRWEGLPISLLEAMYLRKPCIVSDVIGNRDVIRNGENGYICTTDAEFVQAIRTVRDGDPTPLVEAAVTDIETTYNKNVMVQQYREIYERSMHES